MLAQFSSPKAAVPKREGQSLAAAADVSIAPLLRGSHLLDSTRPEGGNPVSQRDKTRIAKGSFRSPAGCHPRRTDLAQRTALFVSELTERQAARTDPFVG